MRSRAHLRLLRGGADVYPAFAAASESLRAASVSGLARAGRRVERVAPGEPLQSVVSRMGWRKVGAVAVVDGERFLGALSEDDVLRVLAARLEERAAKVDRDGDSLVVWDGLLDGLTAADTMTGRDQVPVVGRDASLLDGLAQICASSSHGTRFRYLWVLDEDGGLAMAVSIRDLARFLTRLYDGELAEGSFAGDAQADEARAAVAAVLDLTLGTIRRQISIGHAPSVLRLEASGEETVGRMWGDRRGYVLATLRDGAALGICTRRDLVRGLRNPFVDLGDLRMSKLMSAPVKTIPDSNTLCGLFKIMAIEGCRHMPMVDGADRVVRMVSMWEGVSLFAPRREAAG